MEAYPASQPDMGAVCFNKGTLVAQTRFVQLLSQRAGGKSFMRDRTVRGGPNGRLLVHCSDASCTAGASAVHYESAARSSDLVIRSAGETAKAMVAQGVAANDMFVVVSVHLDHLSTCRSPISLSIKDLAKIPHVKHALLSARSQDDVLESVRFNSGVTISPTDVSRLRAEADRLIHEAREVEYDKLLPFCSLLEQDHPGTFGALVVLKPVGASETAVKFGVFRDTARASSPSLVCARIVHVVVLWPWATFIETLGPPVASADAMHSKANQGQIFNLSMRVAGHYAALLTMWAKTENAEAWKTLFDLARAHLKVIMQHGTSVISDRGKALIAALTAYPDVQHLFDRPHLMRNIMYFFPELKQLPFARCCVRCSRTSCTRARRKTGLWPSTRSLTGGS